MKRFLRVAYALYAIFPPLLTSCGGEYESREIKEYRLALTGDHEWARAGFVSMIDQFNQRAGKETLVFVDDPAQANSAILLTEGLTERDGKVGWGQWITETEEERRFLSISGERPVRTINYSMRLEFDQTYIKDCLYSEDQERRYRCFILFSHEVGHGLLMGHDPSPANVMYEDISGRKDFNGFFQQVRLFFSI